MEIIGAELIRQAADEFGRIGGRRLLDERVEEIAHEAGLAGLALRGVDADIAGALEREHAAVGGDVIGDRVDGFLVIRGAHAADGVEALEAEAERIDGDVARHARGLGGELGDLLPHGEGGVELVVHEGDGHGRRLEHAAQDIARHEDAAVDRRGRLGVGEGREQVRVREHARPLVGIHLDGLEAGAGLDLLAVELRETLVHQDGVTEEELAVVGLFRPDDVLGEKVERGAQVHDHALVEAGIFLLVLGDLGAFLDMQPIVQEVAQLGLGARVLHHALGLLAHLGFGLQLAGGGGLQEGRVRDGIPERESEARSDGVIILRTGTRIEERGVGQREDEGPLGSDLRGHAGGVDVLEVGLLLGGQRAAISRLSEAQREGLELLRAVGRVGLGAGEGEEPRADLGRDLLRALGDGLGPFPRDGGATLIADAAVVGRQGHGNDVHVGGRLRREMRARDQGPVAAGRTPLKLQAGGLVLVFEELDLERVAAAAEEEDGGGGRTGHARAHPEVDERVLLAAAFGRVDVKADAVERRDAELVFAGVGREDRAAPVDAELLGIRALRRRLGAEVEVDDRIDLLLESGLRAVAVRHLRVALGAFTIDGGQSARLGRPEGAAERAKQVGDALAVLADRQVRQLDAGRMITGAGLGGVEGLMDIFGGCRGVGQRQRARIVLRHLPGDILGQGSDRLLADEGFVRLAGDAFAHRTVAAHAVLTVDGFAGPGRRQVLLVVALALTTGEGEDGHADDGEPDLDGPGKGHGVMTD